MLTSLQTPPNAGLGNIYCAFAAAVTAPVIYSTAAGTGGPLLWNGSTTNKVNAYLLGFGWSNTTASTVTGALGITGASGQPSAPTSTTPITNTANLKIGGQAPSCTPYILGTVANAGNFFLPCVQVGTGAITVDNTELAWVELGGAIIVPTACWAAVSASATLTTGVFALGLVWMELPA